MTSSLPIPPASQPIGRLRRVPLREVWKHEAHDFTPWLQDNLDILSEILDLSLVSAEREQSTGTFSVDLVAEDVAGNRVIIENQLEASNHDHLGKLITYLSSLGAETAIWIVSEPRPEHVAAINWLNENTDAWFYLVKVEAVRIEDSLPAPMLTAIVQPNKEGREVKKHLDSTKNKWDEESFFEAMDESCGEEYTAVAQRILDWANEKADWIWWGEGAKSGSFVPMLSQQVKHQLFAVWTTGWFEFYFQWYKGKAPFDAEEKRLELLRRINEIPGIALPESAITKRPNLDLILFQDDDNFKRLTEIFEWFIEEVRQVA